MISVAIMAHKKREHFVPELEQKLDRPATVVWDQINDRWDTGRRALLAYDPAATHHLVVQDDALICRDLVAGVERALERTPGDVPLCLYVGKVRPYKALVDEYTRQAANASFLVMHQLHWGVGIVFPTKIIDEMVAWCDGQTIPNYDSRMSRWFEREGISTWYPWPSLVDHRKSPSLVPGRGQSGRTARRFVGADASALDIDWSGDIVTLPHPIPDRFHRPGVTPMLFRSEKYPNYHVPNIRVQFKDGYAEVTNRSAISYLGGVFMARRGIRQATPQEAEAYAARLTEPVEDEIQEQDSQVLDADSAGQQEPQSPIETPADTEQGEAVQDEVTGVVDAEALADVETVTVGSDGEPSSFGADVERDGDADLTAAVPDGTADDVMAWVGDDTERARAAFEVESGRTKPRKTLLAKLENLTGE